MATTLEAVVRNAACDAVVDLLDYGWVDFCVSPSTLVVSVGFNPTGDAFGGAAAGQASATNMVVGTCSASGTVTVARIMNSATALHFTCGAGEAASALEFVLSSATINSPETLTLSSLTVTVPAT